MYAYLFYHLITPSSFTFAYVFADGNAELDLLDFLRLQFDVSQFESPKVRILVLGTRLKLHVACQERLTPTGNVWLFPEIHPLYSVLAGLPNSAPILSTLFRKM